MQQFSDLNNYYKPVSFIIFVNKLIYLLAIACLVFTCTGIYLGLFYSPSDFQQMDYFRLIYMHVPSAWISMLIYMVSTILSIMNLWYKSLLSYSLYYSSLYLGSFFTFLTLLTGIFWQFPVWGIWWMWDPWLTSVLLTFLMYLGCLFLIIFHSNFLSGIKLSSLLCIIGFVNIPMIKFSVEWWSSLHQSSSITSSESLMHPSVMYMILIMFMAFLFYYLLVLILLTWKQILFLKKENYLS